MRVSLLIGHCSLVIALAAPAGAESLWTAPGSREQSLVADPKAARVGDIVTIVIAESAAQSSSQSKTTNSESSANAAVDQFLFANSKMGTHNGSLPGFGMGGNSEFSGGGSINNSQTLSARAAVLVTDVLPNGQLVIAGARKVTFSGETQHVVLHGIVRREDISSANTVVSSDIADAHLEFISEGALTDAQKRGWLGRIYELIRPF